MVKRHNIENLQKIVAEALSQNNDPLLADKLKKIWV